MSAAEARPTAPPRTAHTGDLVGTFSCSNLFFFYQILQKAGFICFCKSRFLGTMNQAGPQCRPYPNEPLHHSAQQNGNHGQNSSALQTPRNVFPAVSNVHLKSLLASLII